MDDEEPSQEKEQETLGTRRVMKEMLWSSEFGLICASAGVHTQSGLFSHTHSHTQCLQN